MLNWTQHLRSGLLETATVAATLPCQTAQWAIAERHHRFGRTECPAVPTEGAVDSQAAPEPHYVSGGPNMLGRHSTSDMPKRTIREHRHMNPPRVLNRPLGRCVGEGHGLPDTLL